MFKIKYVCIFWLKSLFYILKIWNAEKYASSWRKSVIRLKTFAKYLQEDANTFTQTCTRIQGSQPLGETEQLFTFINIRKTWNYCNYSIIVYFLIFEGASSHKIIDYYVLVFCTKMEWTFTWNTKDRSSYISSTYSLNLNVASG